MLQAFRFQRVFDLTPPIAPALQRDQVLPDGKAFRLQLLAQIVRELGPVFGRVGDENALAENVIAANIAPMVVPKVKKLTSCIFVISPSVGKNTLTITAALAQTRKMIKRTSAKIIWLPRWRLNAARILRVIRGGWPRSICALMA